jgi:Mg2+ and Co2+ transporter CorA
VFERVVGGPTAGPCGAVRSRNVKRFADRSGRRSAQRGEIGWRCGEWESHRSLGLLRRPSTGSEQVRFDRATVEGLLAAGRFFWLDLDQPTAADFEILRDVFRFHPLAVEDSEHFDQRAKLDDYDDFIFIVVYGATPGGDQLAEVHCFYSERFLVTVHHDDCPAFAEIRRRYQERDKTIDQPSLLLYRVVDGLVDSLFSDVVLPAPFGR